MTRLTGVIVGAAILCGALFGAIATVTTADPARPYCPEEDSCTPDYDGRTNTWIIYEDR